MIRRISFVPIIIVLLLAGCSTVRVSQDYRADLDFSWYRSYNWKAVEGREPANIRLDNPLLHERFYRAIDGVLVARGYPRQENPDFLVNYSFSVESRIETVPYGPRFGYSFGRRYRYHEYGFADYYTEINQYEVGILAVSFYDAPSGTLIWRGIGSERMDMHSTPEEITAFVGRLVSAVLAQFPPHPGKR